MALVVVNYGSCELLAGNLAATADGTPGLLVVVVDNYSSQSERTAVLELAARHGWRVLSPDTNIGFGPACNLAVAAVESIAETVVLLNPDARVAARDLAALVRAARSQRRNLVAPRLLRVDGTQASWGSDLLLESGEMRGWHRRPEGVDPTSFQPWLSGACLAMSLELWRAAGGFDDDYFLYWEDVDLSRRVLSAGGELTFLQEAAVVHDQGATHRGRESSRAKSATYYYWNARNRLVFAGKHLDSADQRRWLRSSFGAGYRLLLQGGRRQLLHPGRTLLPVARGTWDGWRQMRRSRRRNR